MALNNVSRLGMRIQETLSERTRDLAFVGKSSNASYFDSGEDKVQNIGKQLDSNSDREKLDAMKRLIAMISKGRNVSDFFALVVKNVASHNLEIRKLVYIYLLRYAEHEPDLALLSINTFQKDLTDPNPLIRAMALRVLSGIRVPMIGSIVVIGIKKCASDPSPYVRKAAALAIPKCYDLDSSHFPELMTILGTLLRDTSPLSIGSVVVAFNALCPERLDLLHQQFRRLCRIVVDLDEWGQINLLDLLARYGRVMLSQPRDAETTEVTAGDSVVSAESQNNHQEVDPDLKLLLTSSEPLFQSRNPAVVFATARIFYYLAPSADRPKIIRPLLRLMHSTPEIESVIVEDFIVIARESPVLLAEHYDKFFIRAQDSSRTKRAKLKVLVCLVTSSNFLDLLREFTEYARDTDNDLVGDSIHAIGHCARQIPEAREQCLTALMTHIRSDQDVAVSSAVLVLKSLHQLQLVSGVSAVSASSNSIIPRLARRWDSIRHPQARACVLWLVGQYSKEIEMKNGITVQSTGLDGLVEWAPDVLRKAAKTFNEEADIVKLQIVNLAAKLLVICPSSRPLQLLSRYVFSLARYDPNYDIRDRGRMLSALLSGLQVDLAVSANTEEEATLEQGGVVLRREQVELVLFGGKLPSEERDSWPTAQKPLGSISLITGRDLYGDRGLPDWSTEGTDSSLRDTEEVIQSPIPPSWTPNVATPIRGKGDVLSVPPTPIVLTPGSSSPAGSVPNQNSGKGAWQDLDKFYADEDESEDESEEEDDEPGEEEGEAGADGDEQFEDAHDGGYTESDESDEEDLEDSRHQYRY